MVKIEINRLLEDRLLQIEQAVAGHEVTLKDALSFMHHAEILKIIRSFDELTHRVGIVKDELADLKKLLSTSSVQE